MMSVPTAIVGFWFLFCFILSIPILIIRAIAVWALIFILTLGSATVNAVRKQQTKK